MTRGNITTIHAHDNELRVRFSCPADGYSLDDLDALHVAIDHARRSIFLRQHAATQTILPTLDLSTGFTVQQARMAAPS